MTTWIQEAQYLAQYGGAKAPTQGLVNNGALAYTHSDPPLTFVWSGNADQPIEVSYGADASVVHWTFKWIDHKPKWVIAGTLSLVSAFAAACIDWTEAKEDAR